METASKDGKFSFWIHEALFLVPLHADAEAAKWCTKQQHVVMVRKTTVLPRFQLIWYRTGGASGKHALQDWCQTQQEVAR
jgi:hypothetical protein